MVTGMDKLKLRPYECIHFKWTSWNHYGVKMPEFACKLKGGTMGSCLFFVISKGNLWIIDGKPRRNWHISLSVCNWTSGLKFGIITHTLVSLGFAASAAARQTHYHTVTAAKPL